MKSSLPMMGGCTFPADFSKNFQLPSGDRLDQYASFEHINNSFATTQYYTVALHPSMGNSEVLAGSQDNSTHTSEDGAITYSKMIGGGDGAYCFLRFRQLEFADHFLTSGKLQLLGGW